MLLEYTGKLGSLNCISKWDLGWILLIILLLVVNRYFNMRIEWEKTTYIRAYLGVYIYDKLFLVMTLVGIILFILGKCNVFAVPDIIGRMHFVRTGICENNHKIGHSQFVFKIRRHLRKDFRLTVIFLANILVSCCHTVVSAYYHYAHFFTFFRLA